MAAAGCVQSEDQFRCSICLTVFIDPVTIPCGHNFCKPCISEHWRVNVPYQCPMCKQDFDQKPQLRINTLISDVVAQFRHEAQHEPNFCSSDQQAAKPGEVPCDACSETKLKALKSCLVCLTSYCQTHLEPHLTVHGLKRHQLIHPVQNLEDRMCRKHDKPLELFCKTDQTCICHHCTYSDHKSHDITPLKEEYEEQKAELKKIEAEIHQMIQERRLKIQEIQRSVELSKNAADRETAAAGVEVFTALMDPVQRSLDQLLEEIQEQQRTTEKQAEDFIKELEQEICELEKRSTEVEQLSGSEDHLHFVQRFICVKAAPPMKTWTKVSVRPSSYLGTVTRFVSELEDKLTEDMKKVVEAELKRVQQYEVDVTLDRDTANPDVILSDDRKQVHDGDIKKKNPPKKPPRFSGCTNQKILVQSFSSDMAAVGLVRSEDQFRCSICLIVFTDPVTTSCGHDFCKPCISEHWGGNVLYQCPMCKGDLITKSQMSFNTSMSKMVAQFRHEAQHDPSSDQQAAKPGEAPGDSKHHLLHPVENLEDWMCKKHDKPLELFCKSDNTCICHHCTYSDHKSHNITPLKDEYEEQKAEMKKTEAEIHQMIQERRLKIQEIQQSVELSKNAADREAVAGVEFFTALMDPVQRSLDQLLEEIQEQQRTTEKQAEDFIKELEQEICELEKRSTAVEQLSGSKDHLHFVQRFTCVKAAPPMKTWTKVSVCPLSYEGTVMRAVSQLQDKFAEDVKKRKKKKEKKKEVAEAELKRVQQYEVDVTLDPDTANPNLILSDDGKQVHDGDVKKNLPDNQQRFSDCLGILAQQTFSSGRFYFEVQVKGKTKWVLGVGRESINRKGQIKLKPQTGYWVICLTNGNEYYAAAGPPVPLSVKSIQNVGVFVDYEEGLVSFYDVASSVLIYSFTGCCFNDKLLPFFSPQPNDGGENSAPLIITPVDTEEEIHQM